MAMAHSKKSACKLIDEAKFCRIEHHDRSLCVDWQHQIASEFTLVELGVHKAFYLDGFIYTWCDENMSHLRYKVSIIAGKIRPDWGYYCTIGDFSEGQLVKYKNLDREMRSMLGG